MKRMKQFNQSTIPLVLVSKSQDKINQFLDNFIQEYKFTPYSIFKIYPKQKEITIDQIRLIRKQIVISSADKRLFVLYSFDRAGIEAQNACLKTLEENTIYNQFILLCENEQNILPTIRSRTREINLDKGAGLQPQKEMQNFITKVIQSANYQFLGHEYVSNINLERAVQLLNQSILYFRAQLPRMPKAASVIKKAFQLKKLLINNNLNPQMTIDNFLIFIKKTLSS